MTRFIQWVLVAAGAVGLGGQAQAGPQSKWIEVREKPLAVFLTVGGELIDPAEACAALHQWVLSASHRAVDAECAREDQIQVIHEAKASGRFRFHIGLQSWAQGSAKLLAQNWSRRDDAAFQELVWNVEPVAPARRKAAIERVLQNFFEVDHHERVLREVLLAVGVSGSKAIQLDASGAYRETTQGQPVSFEQAYELYLRESRENRNWLRASLEIASVLGIGGIWYYFDIALNKEDWEFQYNWEDLRRKVTEGIRFDNNKMYLNSPGHPLAGALYYGFARSNGLNAAQAFLLAFTGSALWEFVVEYREVISINDMIFTPVGGAVIGETMHQLGIFFSRSEGNFIHRVLADIFGGTSQLNRWIAKSRPAQAASLDRYGFPSDVWHRFDLWGAIGAQVFESTSQPTPYGEAGFHTQLITIPGYGTPGDFQRLLTDTAFTELALRVGMDTTGIAQFQFYTQAAWAGFYRQKLKDVGSQNLQGYSFYIGPGSGYEHTISRLAQGGVEELGIVNVLGPVMELTVYTGGFRIRAKMDVFGDFAAVHSFAVDRYESAGGDLAGVKSILRNQRYYYAFGVTTAGFLEVSKGPFEAGIKLGFQEYESIEGLDRLQREVWDDIHLSDSRSTWKAWLGYCLPGDLVRLVVSFEQVRRIGKIGTVTVDDLKNLGMLSLVLRF